MHVIQVEDLTRKYGDTTAVDGINFNVESGEIFGFLGPNGAGKTTTIHMLTTLLRPTSGKAIIDGHDIQRDRRGVRRNIGLVFQEPSLDEQLTARENLRFHAMLYGMPAATFAERSQSLLGLVELEARADALVETFSGGMKRRLEVARGLLHAPKVLFLDEPTLGLDPQTRRLIWDYLRQLRDTEGITVFMTTHYMDEAEGCDRVAVIDMGQIVAIDDPRSLKNLVGGDVVSIETPHASSAVERLGAMDSLEPRMGPDGEVIVEVPQAETVLASLMAELNAEPNPIDVRSVSLRRPTLEDVFIKLTGRAIRDPENAQDDSRRRRRRRRG
ncbi:MAG: ATP-binding cassette domain-containing protein [Anaerolineales bacterium]|jgi:ABC-2 type transport system ATP-binding protein